MEREIVIFICFFSFLMGAVFLSCFIASHKKPYYHDKDFEKWAFGPDFNRNADMSDIPYLWNRKHPELYISSAECTDYSMQKMWQYYKNRRK